MNALEARNSGRIQASLRQRSPTRRCAARGEAGHVLEHKEAPAVLEALLKVAGAA
jgi:hypothetical protein